MQQQASNRWIWRWPTVAKGILIGTVLVVVKMVGIWLLHRACRLGLWNVFSREYTFCGTSALTEEGAVEISRQALVKHGVGAGTITPHPLCTENGRLFARNTLDRDSGYVIWRRKPDVANGEDFTATAYYMVTITQRGGQIRCRVLRMK